MGTHVASTFGGFDLSELLASPRLPVIVQLLQERLQEEAEKRALFYEQMTDDRCMEFINGEIVLHSPAKAREIRAGGNLNGLLHSFTLSRQQGGVLGGRTLCCFPRNDYEPDIVFFGPEKWAKIQPDTMKFPVPDFAVEVLSTSTEARDRGVKFQDYEAHGVSEYWIVNAETCVVEQYVIQDGRFDLRLKSGSGEIESAVVPGFRIPIASIFDEEESLRVMRALLG
jgi:Uma2 family endonuclease